MMRRAGACFQKSAETLLLERLHASRSACAASRQGRAAHPLDSNPTGIQGSMAAPMGTIAAVGHGHSPGTMHVVIAKNDSSGSRVKLSPSSCPPQQQAAHTEPSQESGQDSGCAGPSARLHMEAEPMQPGQVQLLPTGKSTVTAAELQRHDDAHNSTSFLDDVDCLDVE